MNGTYCSHISHLGLFCSEFLSLIGTHCSQIGKLELSCSEFPTVNGTHCSQIGHLGQFVPSSHLSMEHHIGKLGPFCSEFLSVDGTHCSQIDNIGPLCSEFPSVNGTVCSQIGWPFITKFRTVLFRVPILKKKHIVPKLVKWDCFVSRSYL